MFSRFVNTSYVQTLSKIIVKQLEMFANIILRIKQNKILYVYTMMFECL